MRKLLKSIDWRMVESVLIWALVAMVAALVLSGCNTVKGMAKDLYSVTEGIQDEMGNDKQGSDATHNDWE